MCVCVYCGISEKGRKNAEIEKKKMKRIKGTEKKKKKKKRLDK